LNEEDIKLVKQIVKETLYEILETEFYDALFSMLDAFDSGITSFKQQLGAKKGVAEEKPEFSWDPSKIKWEKTEGWKGDYERSEDVNSLDFKELLKDLAQHKGKLTRDGWFYWTFKNGSTVGRKLKQKA
jgi:hypothetical protein